MKEDDRASGPAPLAEDERHADRDKGQTQDGDSGDEAEAPPEQTDPAEFGMEAGFAVRDDDSANWVIRRIVAAREYARRCAEYARTEQARAEREEQFFLFRYGMQLMDYARRRLAETRGRSKTVRLPAGSLSFRTQPEHLVVDDEPAVIGWAKRHDSALVLRVERLDKAGLNRHIKLTGELPDAGARVEPLHEKFYVR